MRTDASAGNATERRVKRGETRSDGVNAPCGESKIERAQIGAQGRSGRIRLPLAIIPELVLAAFTDMARGLADGARWLGERCWNPW